MKTAQEPMSSAAPDRAAGHDGRVSGGAVVTLDRVGMLLDSYPVRVLTGVSFEVQAGELFGLIGPKSCGKSTILRILAGELSPMEGKARVFGRSPRRGSSKARVGYLPGRSGQAVRGGWLGFLDGIVATVRGRRPAREEDTARALQQLRARLAQVLVRNPDLVLFDEPFSCLDASSCEEMKELLRALTQRGKTVILSGDSLAETKDVCTRFAVFHGGGIGAIGALPELLAAPDAVSFLGPVLPQSTAGRVLELIREEIGGNSSPRSSCQASTLEPPPRIVSPAGRELARLAKETAAVAPMDPSGTASDAIDHEQLEKLTRPTPSK